MPVIKYYFRAISCVYVRPLRTCQCSCSYRKWGLGGATNYSESLKMMIFRWQRPLVGTHRITSWLIYILQILCHTSVPKNECHFHSCLVQSRIYWHVSKCSVHFHGYVSICVKGGLKQTYVLVNFEEIFSFKNRINVWISVLLRSVQSRSLLWQLWHVVWQHWQLLTLS